MDYFFLKLKFKDVINSIRPDLIHAGPIQGVAFLAALNSFHPLVSMSWGFDMLEDAFRSILWQKITRFTLRKSDWLIADCQTVKGVAVKFGFSGEKITVFPWGVDLSLFSPRGWKKSREQIGYKNDFLIVHTRSWEPRYGVDIALEGFRLAAKDVPNIQMIMLGGGSQQQKVKSFTEQFGLADKIHFHGYQKNENLADYYRAADAYLSASHIDGSSVALLESMACGCPAIVSDIPSNLEWVRDGVEGWTFEDGNADHLAQKIISAYQKRKELAKFRRAARKKTERDADWANGKRSLMETYRIFSSQKMAG